MVKIIIFFSPFKFYTKILLATYTSQHNIIGLSNSTNILPNLQPHSISISDEIKHFRQHVDPNQEQSETIIRSQFNSLTSLSVPSVKPLSKSLSLFFFHKG